MPFALVIIGLMMVITGAKDTHEELGKQLTIDFTGDKNFTIWLAALGAVGAVGYVRDLQPVSRTFMVLIIIAMVVRNGGFFSQFQSALAGGPETIKRNAPPVPTADGSASPQASAGSFPFGGSWLDTLKWFNQIGGNDPLSKLPGRSEAVGAGNQVRENFGYLMNNFIPFAAHLLGIP